MLEYLMKYVSSTAAGIAAMLASCFYALSACAQTAEGGSATVALSAFRKDQFGATVKLAQDGLHIESQNPLLPPIATARDLDLRIGKNQWLVVRMKAERGEYGSLWISPESRDWKPRVTKIEDQFAFPIRADGEFHTYNVWLGDYHLMPLKPGQTYDTKVSPKFRLEKSKLTGVIRQLGLLPTCEPKSGGVVASLAFATAPDGSPPVLIVEYAGDAVGLNRPGRPGTIAVRVRNAGGSPATGLQIKLQGDGALALGAATLRGVPERIDVDAVKTFYADFTPGTAGRHDFNVEIACREGDRVVATNRYNVELPASTLASGVIPPPVPLKTGYDIGCWIYPAWGRLTHWVATAFAAERTPLLGLYDQNSPVVADWTIKWAVEHGINYFTFLWYVSPKPGDMHPNNRFLSEYFIKSPFLPFIQFNIGWCTDSNPKFETEEHFNADFDYALEHFFSLPQYKKSADGRPIYNIYAGHHFVATFGVEGAKRLLDAASARAKARGFPGVYWIGGYVENNGEKFLQAGMSGQNYYNWIGTRNGFAGAVPDGFFPVLPAEIYYGDAPATWKVMLRNPKLDSYLPVCSGFEDRYWNGGKTPRAFYANNPQKFRDHLEAAKTFMDQHGLKSVLIEAWSEWGEGALIGPHAEFGFGYLDAVADVFAPGAETAPHVGPDDVGVQAPAIPHLFDWIDFTPARPPAAAAKSAR